MAKDKKSEKKKSKKSEGSEVSKISKDNKELSWQEKIIESRLNDVNFKCNVTMFVEADSQYYEYLDKFASSIELGSRRCIAAVSMKDIEHLIDTKNRKQHKENESTKSEKSSSKKEKGTPKKKEKGTPKKKTKDEGPPMESLAGVPRELQELMEQMFKDGVFATDMLALIVKIQLLTLKNKYLEKKEMEIQLVSEIDQETKDICDQKESGKKGKEKKIKSEKKAEKKKKRGEKGDGDRKIALIETVEKKMSKLRKRGEEWRDISYIEDSPVEGPDLYVALIGFYDPKLPLELRKAGVPVQGIIKIGQKTFDQGPFPSTVTTTDLAPVIEEEDVIVEDDSFFNKTYSEEMMAQNEILPEEEEVGGGDSIQSTPIHPQSTVSSFGLSANHPSLIKGLVEFWNEINKPEMQKMMKDIAVVDLVPQNVPLPPEDEPEAWLEKVYNELSYVMYDLEDMLRHHSNYLDSICVQFLGPYPPLEKSEMELYDTMVDLMPAECTSVAYVLHCMLEQVLMFQAPPNPSPTPQQSFNDVYMLSNEQCDTDAKKHLEAQLDLLEIHYGLSKCQVFDYEISDPKVLLYGDIQLQLTREIQIPEINIAQITIDLLKWYPFIKLWEWYPQLDGSEHLMYSYHIRKLLECMELDFLTEHLLRFYLMLSVFEKMSCSFEEKCELARKETELKHNPSLSSQNERCNPIHLINSCKSQCQSKQFPPHDIRNLKHLFECPELINLLHRIPECSDGEGEVPKIEQHFYTYKMFRYIHMEMLRPQVMLQALQDSLSRYNCIDYQYFKPTDTLLFKFHNVQEQLKWEDHWSACIRTPVAFKDFSTYVSSEEEDWIKYQEELYKKYLEQKSKEKPDVADAETQISAVKKVSCPSHEFRLENSLKDKNEEEKKKISSTSKIGEKVSTVSFELDSEKKSKGKEEKENLEKAVSLTGMDSERPKEQTSGLCFKPSNLISALHFADTKSYSFVGYDLGCHRLQNSGATTLFNSPDGTTVKIELTKWLYGNTLIYSEFNKRAHTLSLYSYSGPPPFVDEPLTFHVTTSSGIILVFSRRNPLSASLVEEPVTIESPPQEQEVTEEISVKSSKTKHSGKKDKKGKDGKKGKKSATAKKNESEKDIEISEEPKKEEEAPEPPQKAEVNFMYDMLVTCPNSLTIETVVCADEVDPFYIKQRYITKGPKCDKIRDELCRCFLRNGNILIFKTDGTIKILTLDSTVILCREFQPPQIPAAEAPPPTATDIEIPIEVEDKSSKKKKSKTPTEHKNKKGRKGKKEKENIVQEDKLEEVEQKENVCTPLPIIPLWDIISYEVWTAHGGKYTVSNGRKEIIEPPFLLRSATDFESGEVYTRREEGTNTLLKPDGTLVIAYPDDSRITATPEYDDEEFQWTPEEEREIQELALTSTISVKDSTDTAKNDSTVSVEGPSVEGPQISFSQVVENFKGSSNMSELQSSDTSGTSVIRDSIHNSRYESYVVITMNCTAEHPNYATVQFNGHDQSAFITFPTEMKIHMNARGTYKAILDAKTVLDVQPMSIRFEANVCDECQSTSRTYVGLRGFQDVEKAEGIMSSTTDNWGNTFNVEYSGATKHHIMNLDESISADLCPPKSATGQARYLVLQRDLSGIEFVHSDDLQDHLTMIEATPNASLNIDPMPGKTEIFNCYISFMPLPKTVSGKWIKSINLESHLPAHLKRKDLSRSTYGDPPSWLFPFPRQRSKKAKLTSSAISIQNAPQEEKFPKFLVLRIVQDLEAIDHNIIDSVQAGLARYWQVAQNMYQKYDSYKMEDIRTPEEIELEEKLFELTVTQTPREIIEMYRKGINPATSPADIKVMHKSSKHQIYLDAFYKKMEDDKEHAEFYRNLLKLKSVPKYFDTIQGESFVTVLETVEEAVNISRYDCTEYHEHTEACRNVAMKEKCIKALLEDMLPVGDCQFQSKRIQVSSNDDTASVDVQTSLDALLEN